MDYSIFSHTKPLLNPLIHVMDSTLKISEILEIQVLDIIDVLKEFFNKFFKE